MNCNVNPNKMPQFFIDILMTSLRNPSGHWSDFNHMTEVYKSLQYITDDAIGYMCESDLGNFPKTTDYPV